MPPPGNTTDFLTVVEKSGLLDEDDIDHYRFRSAADPSPPDRVAKWMMMDGRLTPFQVELLLAGKSRPFFVGPYKVLSRIGNGSMGVVYLCEHRGMGRKVAVKFLQKRRAEDEVALERFLREARAAAALNHPNVVHALDFGCEWQLHYLVMEYIEGRSLKARVLEEGPIPPLKVADYLRQAALGVQHAHEAGLIHRDIKPSNLMIDRSGIVKLLDLGLALFEESAVDLTRGKPLGTMAYIAPEQALDSHAVDARADIYSLGATFYLALAGRAPRPGTGIGDSVPPELTDWENFERLMTVLRRMTACSPADRYQSAAEVIAEMDLILLPPTTSSDELSPVQPPPVGFETFDSVESNSVDPPGQTATGFDTVETLESVALVENTVENDPIAALTIDSPVLSESTSEEPSQPAPSPRRSLPDRQFPQRKAAMP